MPKLPFPRTCPEKGMSLKEDCNRACVSCEACVKACNFGAITMENNVPVIISDDAHETKNIGRHFDEAGQLIRDLNL